MSIASGIESLGGLVPRLRAQERGAVADVVRQMRSVEEQANESSLDALARLCRTGARSIDRLANDAGAFQAHAAAIGDHLERLCAFATKCIAAIGNEADLATIVPPAPLAVRDAEEEKAFAEAIALFVPHATAAIAELEQGLLALPSAGQPAAAIAGMRRTVHTLKAEFGGMGRPGAQALCHQAETTIDACTESGRPIPVDALRRGVAVLKRQLDSLTQGVQDETADVEPLLAELRAIAASGDAAEGAVMRLEAGGEFAGSRAEFVTAVRARVADAEAAMVALLREPGAIANVVRARRAYHTIKAVAGFLNVAPLVELTHAAETLLDAAHARSVVTAEEVRLLRAASEMIRRLLASLEGQRGPQQREWRQLLSSLQAAGGGGVSQRRTGEVRVPAPVTIPAPAVGGGDGRTARIDHTLAVSSRRLGALVDGVGELVVGQARLLLDPVLERLDGRALARDMRRLASVAREVQEAAMSLCVVPLAATFRTMAVLARDVAGKTGKEVVFATAGDGLELDRVVVEQLAEPLVHLIRNAIDHGIETQQERRAARKEPAGRLSLRAHQESDAVVIEVRDDGRGLDRARIVAKAIQKGMLAADAAARSLSDAEVFELIFAPGFSTADEVTELSGRGIGMDVVRRSVETMRGSIQIDSRAGTGTTFRMRLPLPLAIVDGMVVRVGNSRYVVPILCIERVLRPSAADVHHLFDAEHVRVRGSVLPVHRLKNVFAQADGLDDLTAGMLIVVAAREQRSCLFVDEVLGRQQVVGKSLGTAHEGRTGTSGAGILTDGRVALILDVGTLVESAATA